MTNAFPFISIIMPCFNGAKYLHKAIESFIIQDYPIEKKELIIVGNKSTDASNDIIKEFVANNSNIRWIDIVDRGISHASNVGIENSKGDILGKLGVDDIFIKDVFKEVAYFSQLVEWDALYFNAYSYYPIERKCVLHRCPDWEINHSNLIKKGVPVGGEDIFFKREILSKFIFNEDNKYSMDFELLLEITKNSSFLAIHIDKPCTFHHFDGNITSDADGKQLKELHELVNRFAEKPEDNYFNMYFANKADENKIEMSNSVFNKVFKKLKDITKTN